MSARSFTLDIKKKQGNIQVDTWLDGEGIAVKLHGHLVAVKNTYGEIILSSCGYHTPTTKVAINRFLDLIGVNASVVQQKGTWYIIEVQGKEYTKRDFYDGMKLGTKLDRVLE